MLSLEAGKRRKRRNKLVELIGPVTDWAKSELADCFDEADLDFDGDFYLDSSIDGDYVGGYVDGDYAEGVTINGRGANVFGKLYVFGATAERVAMAIRIESAESIADLPEGLSSADEDIRDLAHTALVRMGLDTDEF